MDEAELVNALCQDALKRSFKIYGVEGTEQKIRELCSHNPTMLEVHLRNYEFLLKGGGKNNE